MLKKFIENASTPELKKGLVKYEHQIESFYREFLGGNYKTLVKSINRHIDSDSFKHSEMEYFSGTRPGFGLYDRIEMPKNFMSVPQALDYVQIHTAPIFRLGAENLKLNENVRPKLPKHMDSFVHVFSKFMCYGVQEVPANAVLNFLVTMLNHYGACNEYPKYGDALKTVFAINEGVPHRIEKMFWNGLGYDDRDCMEPARIEGLKLSGMSESYVDDEDVAKHVTEWYKDYSDEFIQNCDFVDEFLHAVTSELIVNKMSTSKFLKTFKA